MAAATTRCAILASLERTLVIFSVGSICDGEGRLKLPIQKSKCLISIVVISVACTARPHAEPSKTELVGTYGLTELPAACRSPSEGARLAAVVQLEADGSFEIDGLPSCIAGVHAPASTNAGTVTGEWSVAKVEGEYVLELSVRNGPLQSGWNLGIEIRGSTAPYELYFRVGDPDNRTGLVFLRN